MPFMALHVLAETKHVDDIMRDCTTVLTLLAQTKTTRSVSINSMGISV